jgi:hypothetical protein
MLLNTLGAGLRTPSAQTRISIFGHFWGMSCCKISTEGDHAGVRCASGKLAVGGSERTTCD